MTTQTRLDTVLETARQAALAAGTIQQDALGGPIEIHTKSTGIDLVTQVDLACDRVITDMLRTVFPDHRIISEETYEEGADFELDRAWVIDPLDGTTNFAHSFPHFAVSIAYFENGQPQAGVVYDASKHELFSAMRQADGGLSGSLEDTRTGRHKPLKTSAVATLDKALLATGFPYNLGEGGARNNLDHLARMLVKCHGVRRPGAAALDLAYVACGRLDGFWEITLSPWDVAAGALLVEAAGGRCVSMSGQPLDFASRRIDIAAANGEAVLAEMLAAL